MSFPDVGFNYKRSAERELQVIELEMLQQRQHKPTHPPDKPHRIGFYNLIVVEQGQGSHQVDFNRYAFQAGDFIAVQRHQIHAFDFSSPVKGKVLLFTQRFVDQALANMRLSEFSPTSLDTGLVPVFTPDQALRDSCFSLLDEIEKELAREDSNTLIAMHLFSSLFLMLRRARPPQSQGRLNKEQQQRMIRFATLLEQQFQSNRDAASYAEQLHCTYKTLNQLCKLATGKTAKQIIDAFTVLEAKRRLSIDRLTTQQLAYDLGFEDASNFVKYFKKHTGFTPARFQKQLGLAQVTAGLSES